VDCRQSALCAEKKRKGLYLLDCSATDENQGEGKSHSSAPKKKSGQLHEQKKVALNCWRRKGKAEASTLWQETASSKGMREGPNSANLIAIVRGLSERCRDRKGSRGCPPQFLSLSKHEGGKGEALLGTQQLWSIVIHHVKRCALGEGIGAVHEEYPVSKGRRVTEKTGSYSCHH